jgi:ankyrin repeat protein
MEGYIVKSLYSKSLKWAFLTALALQISSDIFAMENGKRKAEKMEQPDQGCLGAPKSKVQKTEDLQDGETNNPAEQQGDNPEAAANTEGKVNPVPDISLTMVDLNSKNQLCNLNDDVIGNILVQLISPAPNFKQQTPATIVNAIKQLVKLCRVCKRFRDFVTNNIKLIFNLANININAVDESGLTALHFAFTPNGINSVFHDSRSLNWAFLICGIDSGIEPAKWLLRAGANINAVDNNKLTPLKNAVRYASPTDMSFLINTGVNVNFPINDTPLCLAVNLNQPKIVKILLEKGADVIGEYEDIKHLALYYATHVSHIEDRTFPWKYCVYEIGYKEIAQILVDHYIKHEIAIPEGSIPELKELGVKIRNEKHSCSCIVQ